MLMKKGKLFVFSAPSGTGKTTIIKNVLSTFPDLTFSISATTRARRKSEERNKDYFFLNVDEFKEKVENEEFERTFAIYSSDHNEALQFVTPDLQSHLLGLIPQTNGSIFFGLYIKYFRPDPSCCTHLPRLIGSVATFGAFVIKLIHSMRLIN